MKISQWNKFRNYINQTKIGDNITRQGFLKEVYKTRKVWTSYSTLTTIDAYRLSLTKLGILTLITPGVYKVNYHINENTSIGKIQKLAYRPRSWRNWFIEWEDIVKNIIK